MKFHAAVAKALADHGINTIFGLIGDGNLYMIDSFVRDCGGMFVSATHEANAAIMALGYASTSGTLGVASVTHGPALTNTLTALVEGARGRLPMVLLCGDTAAEDRDGLQVIAQRELIVATGAGFEQLRSANTLSHDVAMAIRRAVLERRPIALNVPVEFQWLDVDYIPAAARVPDRSGMVAVGPELENAIGMIAASKRPVIVAGRGAYKAREQLLRLAARIEAPYGNTLRGRGIFHGSPYDLGTIGTLSTPTTTDIILEADCLIFFGASISKHTASFGTFLKGKRIIQCSDDPAEIGRFFAVDASLVGDCARVVETIVGWLDEAEIPPSGFATEALQRRLRGHLPVKPKDRGTDDTIDLRIALERVNATFPQDRVAVFDSGRFVRTGWDAIGAPDPLSFVYSTHFGSIGLGLPYAIGAALAAPGRPILLIMGDGGFMLGGVSEFNTAVRYGIDLTVFVCNDGSYGAEHIQFRRKGMDPSLATFDWPEFGPLAEALGGRGFTVRNNGELEDVLTEIGTRSRPTLVDLKIDPDHVTQD